MQGILTPGADCEAYFMHLFDVFNVDKRCLYYVFSRAWLSLWQQKGDSQMLSRGGRRFDDTGCVEPSLLDLI